VTVERGDQELIWSIHGEEKIASRLRDLIGGAKRRIQILTTELFLQRVLLPDLQKKASSIGIEIIAGRWEGPLPTRMKVHVSGPLVAHAGRLPMETAGVFIFDDEKAMVVMGIPEEAPTGLLSESPGFLRFFSQIWSMNLALASRPDQ